MSDMSVQSGGSQNDSPPRPSDRSDGPPWRAADFQQALRRAKQDQDSDTPPGPLPVPQRREALTFKADMEEAGKVDIVPGQADRSQAAPATEPAAVLPGSPVDLTTFAAMLDRAWIASFADGAKAVQVRFLEQAWPMTALSLVRLPDGALSLTLAASGHAVPQVSKTLESLRRRLEARGLDIAELQVEADGETGAGSYVGRAG